MSEMETGLDRARAIYQDRTRRARELKAEGKQVIGYFDIYPVLEMLTALDLVPYRILGDMNEPITKADACLPTVVCPFIRSVMDLGLKGRYDFLDGVVMAHGCEVAEKTAHIWRTYLNPAYAHFIDTPHTTHTAALEQHKELLKDFKKTLEAFAGKELTLEKLRQAIEVHNEQRLLVRELYDLRKPDPPLISGTETLQVLVALASLPVTEGNELLRQVIRQAHERRDGPRIQPARLLLWGSIIDNTAIIDLIESLGANVVMDDTSLGSRAYFPLVEQTGDPLDGLANRYLVALKSPRTFRETVLTKTKRKDYLADLENRFSYLKDYAQEWKVNGVILEVLRYCDIHGYEVPGLKDYLDHIDLPSIYLEHDYSQAALAQLRTRVQAFLEVIG
ncbi:MAG TPA: 2-hydroxyacyl-CoA dehydratase [Dehalococcoidia bacterium]|nr:2-hydroxyacyl-CoA dehydratase [Dehalococcoidia bacterium]